MVPVRPRRRMPFFWSCMSQSLGEAPTVGAVAPCRRATVVYLSQSPWTALNK